MYAQLPTIAKTFRHIIFPLKDASQVVSSCGAGYGGHVAYEGAQQTAPSVQSGAKQPGTLLKGLDQYSRSRCLACGSRYTVSSLM